MRLLLAVHVLLESNHEAEPLLAGINASTWLTSHEHPLLGLTLEVPRRSKKPAETWSRFQKWADELADRAIEGTVG
jgi:hypothetical protein